MDGYALERKTSNFEFFFFFFFLLEKANHLAAQHILLHHHHTGNRPPILTAQSMLKVKMFAKLLLEQRRDHGYGVVEHSTVVVVVPLISSSIRVAVIWRTY